VYDRTYAKFTVGGRLATWSSSLVILYFGHWIGDALSSGRTQI